MITPRQRNNLVLIQNKVETTDAQWGNTYSWTEYGQFWVSIDPQRGREIFTAGENEAVITHKIRGDYQELIGVTEAMRIIFDPSMSYDDGASPPSAQIPSNARVFDILAVMPDYEHRGDVMISVQEFGRRYNSISTVIPQ